MPSVEGFTPQILWTTLWGVFAICLLFLIVFKVYDAIHVIRERQRNRSEAEKPDFAKKVSQEVIAELGPRLEAIERRVSQSENRLDAHDRTIASMTDGHKNTHEGLAAIAKFLLIFSAYGNFTDNEKVKEASVDLQKFLAEKM